MNPMLIIKLLELFGPLALPVALALCNRGLEWSKSTPTPWDDEIWQSLIDLLTWFKGNPDALSKFQDDLKQAKALIKSGGK